MRARRWTATAVLLAGGLFAAAAEPEATQPAAAANLCRNGDFRQADRRAADFQLAGGATIRYLGDPRADVSGWGVGLDSTAAAGAVSQTVAGIDPAAGRWFRFAVRGLPEEQFAVAADGDLYLRVDFLGADGTTNYDAKVEHLYGSVARSRRDLSANGVGKAHGAEAWRTYAVDFKVPFPQVRQFRLSVGFDRGTPATRPAGKLAWGDGSAAFLVTDFSLVRIPDPGVAGDPSTRPTAAVVPPYDHLVPLGGRWSYAARAGETAPPAAFDAANADRLLYRDLGVSAPFAGNTTAWLRAGDRDAAGRVVTADRFVPNNLTITLDATSLVLHTHGLPNHPTGLFPDRGFGPDPNPNAIREQDATYHLPLVPAENRRHVVTAADNSNHALPMGPIGIAVNGVVFFNPFDAGSADATDLMDRCCGHPNPFGQYHYHKYPICVNSPWADEGAGHSPLIGFAFDGFPVYGPYESADVMAKDVQGEHAPNGFNLHYDAARGWHYHATPGRFPYLIGGYWGTEDPRDAEHPGRGRTGRPPG